MIGKDNAVIWLIAAKGCKITEPFIIQILFPCRPNHRFPI